MIKITAITGDAVSTLLQDPAFMSDWSRLAAEDPTDTTHQEPGFVQHWYQSYQPAYDPLLLLGHDAAGGLQGLLFLGQNREDGQLVHAGGKHAEYTGWIAPPAYTRDFLIESLIFLKQTYGLVRWEWGWLPAGVNPEELQAPRLKQAGIYCTTQHQEVPFWDLRDEERMKKALKSRSFKSKINRLKKRGEVRFEKITSTERLRELLPTIAVQSDFRKEATYDTRPFADNPYKADGLLTRMEDSRACHSTALFLNDQLLAFHFGTAGRDRVYLGLSTYDPSESKSSPGSLLLVMLGELLQQEGYAYLDLTPGTDPYKERYATEFQPFTKPTLYFSWTQYCLGQCLNRTKAWGKSSLLKYTNPHYARIQIANVKETFRILQDGNLGYGLEIMAKTLYSRHHLTLWEWEEQEAAFPEIAHPLPEQRYEDLFLYAAKRPYITRRRLLMDALDRFSAGEQVFTEVDPTAQALSLCCWAKPDPDKIPPIPEGEAFPFPENSVLLHAPLAVAKTSPASRAQFLQAAIRQLKANGWENIFLLTTHQQKNWGSLAQQNGFRKKSSYRFHQIMGYRLQGDT